MTKKTLKLKFEDLENPKIISLKDNTDFINETNGALLSFISCNVNFVISGLRLLLVAGLALSFSPLITGLMVLVSFLQLFFAQKIMKVIHVLWVML